ncbi:TPA: extracellular solute-binding protein [Clostridioides difficile]
MYKSPETPFVADFIGTINFIDDGINKIAIRPEDIKVEFNRDSKDKDIKVGEILDIEFRGFNYRITVEYCSKQMKLDVVSKVAEQMKLCTGSKINFKIPKEGIVEYKSAFKDDKEVPSWVGIDAWMTGITVNTKELKNKNIPIPSSYEDLIKPEYKGLISMPNPSSSGTGYLTVSALIQIMGEEKAWQYMDKLHENIGVYTQFGSAPATSAASGEYPIGISFGYRGIKLKEEGYPVEVVFPKEGSGWDIEANALVKKDNIKEVSKVFLDWAISKDAMNEYSKNYAVTTISTGNPIPEGFPKKPLEQMIDNDLKSAAKNRENILNKWISKYDGKTEKES